MLSLPETVLSCDIFYCFTKISKQSVRSQQKQFSTGIVINISRTPLPPTIAAISCRTSKEWSNYPKKVRHSVMLVYFNLHTRECDGSRGGSPACWSPHLERFVFVDFVHLASKPLKRKKSQETGLQRYFSFELVLFTKDNLVILWFRILSIYSTTF